MWNKEPLALLPTENFECLLYGLIYYQVSQGKSNPAQGPSKGYIPVKTKKKKKKNNNISRHWCDTFICKNIYLRGKQPTLGRRLFYIWHPWSFQKHLLSGWCRWHWGHRVSISSAPRPMSSWDGNVSLWFGSHILNHSLSCSEHIHISYQSSAVQLLKWISAVGRGQAAGIRYLSSPSKKISDVVSSS